MEYKKIQELRLKKELLLQSLIENSKTTRSLEEELNQVSNELEKVHFVMGDFDKTLNPTEHELYIKHFVEGKNLKVCSQEIPLDYVYTRKLKTKIKNKINIFIKEHTQKIQN